MSVTQIQLPRPRWEWLKMQFENKITTGAILQLVVMICGFIAFLLNSEHRMTLMESAQQQFERRIGDQENQMRIFQQQLTRIMTSPIGKTNEFSQTPN